MEILEGNFNFDCHVDIVNNGIQMIKIIYIILICLLYFLSPEINGQIVKDTTINITGSIGLMPKGFQPNAKLTIIFNSDTCHAPFILLDDNNGICTKCGKSFVLYDTTLFLKSLYIFPDD